MNYHNLLQNVTSKDETRHMKVYYYDIFECVSSVVTETPSIVVTYQ